MSINQKIAHNTIIQIASKILSTALGLLAVSLMTRYLGTEQFGWYVAATGFLQFIGIFTDFGFTLTTTYALSEEAEDKTRVFNTLFTWRLVSAIVFYGASVIIAFLLPYTFPVKAAIAITSVSFFFQTLNQVFIGYHQANLTTRISVIGENIGRLCLVAGILVSPLAPSPFFFAMAAISVASIAYTSFFIFRHRPIRFHWNLKNSAKIFTVMWPTAVTVMFNAVYLQGDRLILPFFAEDSDIGLYGAAYRILDIVIQVAAIVMGIMMPLLTVTWIKNLHADFRKHFQTAFDLLLFLLLPSLATILALPTELMTFIAGDKFADGGPILFMLAFTILGIIFGMMFGHTVLALGRQKQAIAIYASDAILSLIGYFIFIPRYGIYGAAGVTIFSELYAGIGLFILMYRTTHTIPDLKRAFLIFVASVLSGLTMFLLGPTSLLLALVAGGALYFSLAWVMQLIPRQTLLDIVRLRKRSIP